MVCAAQPLTILGLASSAACYDRSASTPDHYATGSSKVPFFEYLGLRSDSLINRGGALSFKSCNLTSSLLFLKTGFARLPRDVRNHSVPPTSLDLDDHVYHAPDIAEHVVPSQAGTCLEHHQRQLLDRALW